MYNAVSYNLKLLSKHGALFKSGPPPFGMQMEERSYTSGDKGYRFAFNGKEKDSEGMGGGGSTYDYGFRIYNAQLGKFLSVDPLTKSYPWYTPYQFAGNKVIEAIDLDGLEEFRTSSGQLIYSHSDNGIVYIVDDEYIEYQVLKEIKMIVEGSISDGTLNVKYQFIYEDIDYSSYKQGELSKAGEQYRNLMANANRSQIGDKLMGMYEEDPSCHYNGQYNQCSPTSFKRYKEAFESINGDGTFGKLGGKAYKIWNMYPPSYALDIPDEYQYNSISPSTKTAGPGALLYLGATDKMLSRSEIWSGGMNPGGILRLDHHSVIFLGYTYNDKNEIIGLNYWDQHTTKTGDEYLYISITKEYEENTVVSGANPKQ